ncbi:MAG: restriction endonuclease subunit S [Phocaeicola vulgatus]|uniref:restriction endonuclease subunit S n=1 Tax=Prevotella heparinolytica TaxID=28113 RepID=UPI0035A09F5A|nr:restriction endonuclease subunit S [Phocaeicola vulgatus]
MPFEVPEGWVWVTLKEITSTIGDGLHGTPQYNSEGDYFFINGNNLSNRKIVIKNETKRVSVSEYEKYKKPLNRSSILVSINGTIGNIGIYDGEKIMLGKSACYMNMVSPINIQYICIILESQYFLKYAIDSATGSTIKNVPLKAINNFKLPFPPISEQQRIVAEIEQWFALIDQIEQEKSDLQTIIKQTKSKILDLAIHGKLVPQDPNDEPAIELLKRINPDFTPCDNGHRRKLPQGWAYCQLSNVLKITMGQSPKGDSLNNKKGIEFHQGKICFSDKFLLDSGIYTNEPTKIAEPNSILLCVRAPVGVVNITKNQICIGRGLCALTPFEGNADFYFYLLQTLQDSFDNQSTGTTFKAISGEIIRNENIILPPLAEQQRIVQKIEELFHVLDNIQNALEV